MGTFTVPNTIQSGDPSDATKAMANWNQVVNDLNAGQLIDATNCNQAFAKGNVEPAFSNWKPLLFVSTSNLTAVTANSPFLPYFYFDPAQYAAGGRTTQVRVRATLNCNTVFGGGITVTAFLAPITSTPGASGQGSPVTAGASTCTAASSPTSGLSHKEGTAVGAPAAGFYVLGVVTSANNANAIYDVSVILEIQQV